MTEATPVPAARSGGSVLAGRLGSLAARLLRPRAAPEFEVLVRQIYLALLGREADPEGFAYWSGVAAKANSIEPVVRAIAASEEHRTLQGYRFATQANELAVFS